MKLAEGESSLSSYPAFAPPGGAAQATLTSHRLVWLQGTQEEHYPLDKITAVTYGFERASRRISWAVAMLVFAVCLGIFLAWAQANLPSLAESMVRSLADSESPQRIEAARSAYRQRVEVMTLMILPLWGLAGMTLAYASWLLYTGIRGKTRVVATIYAITRLLERRGRDPDLLEFGELLAQRACGLQAVAVAEPPIDQHLIDWIPKKTG